MEFTRIPPQALNVEKHVLGAMLLDQEAISPSLDRLEAPSFYDPRHALIFSSIRELTALNRPVDLLTLSQELRRVGNHDRAGGDAYLLEISAEVVSAANILEHAAIVRDREIKRRHIALGTAILERGYSEEPSKETQEFIEREIYALAEKHSKQKTLRHIREILTESLEAIERRMKGELVGLPTGISALDLHMGGMQPGALIVIGGRPGQGKTSIAGQIGISNAKENKTVAFFECEMKDREIVDRALFAQAGINQELLRRRTLTERDYPKLAMAVAPLTDIPFFIDDSAGITPSQLRSKCRRLKNKNGLDLIIVDNIQRMKSESRSKDIRVTVSEVSASLKEIAKEFEVPVLGISHMRRLQGGDSAEPTLSDLQESGNIEQDADIVALIHRPDMHKDAPGEEGKAKIIFAKFREGSLGYVDLFFEKTLTTFYDWDRKPTPEFNRKDWET